MYEYRHGGNVHAEPEGIHFLDLSASLNPLGPPRQVDEAIRNAIAYCSRYPDSRSAMLRERIAAFENVPTDSIFCGNGSSDIIFRLPSCAKKRRGLVFRPTFSDYERAMKVRGLDVTHHLLSEKNGFACDERALATLDTRGIGIAFLCNPNNPTGILTERSFIERLLQRCRNTQTLLVIDECFIDFCNHADEATAKPLLSEYPNLVILKALTKTFALPGIRLGYALCCDPSLIDTLYLHGPDWPVSNLAQAAGIAALNQAERFIEETVAYVAEERRFVRTELEHLGFHVFDGRANYLFFKNRYEFNLKEKLDAKSIRIRSFDHRDDLGPEYARIGLLQHWSNLRFVEAVRSIVGEQSVT